LDTIPGPASRLILTEALEPLNRDLLRCGPQEAAALHRALAGRFIAAGPSGAPTRGRPEVLPTGRNFFSIDSRALPTPTAWRLGWASANAVIERYLQDHGNWPKAMVLSAWGTSNMRTGGDDIAQALAFMGVQPVWDSASRRVTGFDVIPLDVLDRPRIDVSLRCSGFFRDAFPAQMSLIDRAVQAVAKLDEPDDMNPLAAAVRRETAASQAAGLSLDAAVRKSTLRVFSAKPGAYGAGLQTLIDEGIWDNRSDFAEAFLVWSSYAYGDGVAGSPARDMLEVRLGDADAVLHNQDNREHDILDSDDYYQFAGGLSAAVSHISGRDVPIYHNDHSLAENPITRSLAEEISRVVRGRASNPKWIKGAMRHGYKGAFEMAATVDYLFAFAATTRQVGAHHFAALYEAYIEDDAVRAFLQTANDAAYADMLARFAEAIERGLWTPRRNSVQAELERLQNNLVHDHAPQ
jgi:cobaltochelatase CobN